MKTKFSLRLISLLGSSLLLTLQFAPLATAQSGNMSDGTGVNINSGNMSDATGIDLEALLDGTLTEINGIAITAEFRAFLLSIINGSFEFNSVFNALIQSGVPANLATSCVTSLRGLFVGGQLNVAQLAISAQIYRQIVATSGVNLVALSNFGVLQSITTLLAIYGADMSFPVATVFPIGARINGILITAELQQLILELSSGETRGIGQLVSALVQSGVRGNVASEFARSLRGLFINGRLDIAQLIMAGQLYQQIIRTPGLNIGRLIGFGQFKSITSILIAFGFDNIAGVPIGPGNLSDATNVIPANVETEAAEEVEVAEEETAEQVAEEETAEQVAEEETAEQVAEEDTTEEVAVVEDPLAESDVETAEVAEEETAEEVAEVATTSESESTTSTTTTSSEQGNSGSNLSDSTGVLISSNRYNAGAVSAMNAIVTTSDIVGGTFQFASSSILIAVIQRAQSLISLLLGSSQVSFANVSISIQVRQTVVSVITSSSSLSASVPTYVSSLNGGGTLTAAASVDAYTNSLIDGGVPATYARALADTMEGILIVDENGEVTGVDATKLTTATAVYNETVNQLDAEALSAPSEVLTCTGLILSSLGEAAASAAN